MPSQIPSHPHAPPHLLPVCHLPGIGPKRSRALAEARVHTIWDVLHELPRQAPPPPPWCDQGDLPGGMAVRLRAQVRGIRPLYRGRRGRALEVLLQRQDGLDLRARFFNAAYLAKRLTLNGWYQWEGRLDAQARILLHPRFHPLERADEPLIEDTAMRVRYRAIDGCSVARWMTVVGSALRDHLQALRDPLGELSPLAYQDLFIKAHQPTSVEEHLLALRALARREVQALAWRLQELLPEGGALPGRSWAWRDEDDQRHRQLLRYSLSQGQEEALVTLRQDMRSPSAMCRLLQGEVGSGKTALALLCCLAVVADGAQALVLAPTTILAEQHYQFFSSAVAATGHRCALLSAGLSSSQRQRLLDDARAGVISIIIGTHALLHQSLELPAVGLVVIDEQHRFGVAQRMAAVAQHQLRQGWAADLLLLSATPIPRTLALTIYGGMAMTQLRGMPPDRAGVTTELKHVPDGEAIIPTIIHALEHGGRIFVVCSRKYQSTNASSASEIHRLLSQRLKSITPVALVHGDLEEEDKREAMASFQAGKARVLVSTSVIEVGIDVPEATHLVVMDSERFGLAQLHQLRGRLGRGHMAGRCILGYGSSAASTASAATAEPPARVQLLCQLNDGLSIAEADLAERGPGNLLGTLQHGAFALRIAELARDLDLLHQAHESVRELRARQQVCGDDLRRFLRDDDVTLMTP